MEISLLKNKPEFVKLLLETKKFSIKKFLTHGRLIFLYNSLKVSFIVIIQIDQILIHWIFLKLRQSSKKLPFFQLFLNQKKYFYQNQKETSLITINGLKKFLQDYLFESFQSEFLNETFEAQEWSSININSFLVK